jgi:hypothetical protein
MYSQEFLLGQSYICYIINILFYLIICYDSKPWGEETAQSGHYYSEQVTRYTVQVGRTLAMASLTTVMLNIGKDRLIIGEQYLSLSNDKSSLVSALESDNGCVYIWPNQQPS